MPELGGGTAMAHDETDALPVADPAAALAAPEGVLLVVANFQVRVRMHESGTSAAAMFVDEQGRTQRVSLIARRGGGALTTSVAKRYEPAVQELGLVLWPLSEWRPRPSGIYRVAF